MVHSSDDRKSVSAFSKERRDAHDEWMRMIRDVDAFTENPEGCAENTVRINDLQYHVAHVGTTIKYEEYRKLLTASKKQPPKTSRGERVILSHAYRLIKDAHADNEFARQYDNKLFVTYVNVTNSPKGKEQSRAPLNFVDRVYDQEIKTSLGMDKRARTAKWTNFDNYPKDSTHPKFCVRYYHNQVRPRSGACVKRAADTAKEAVKKKLKVGHVDHADTSAVENADTKENGFASISSLYTKYVGDRVKSYWSFTCK
ncbi:hypothetical protein CYMTET_41015 [Cymbomonas tetramitiformis]|uniref:Uncharacterized protein n=1 Tax=Cymbomonas tetramitiformis TaxID=36881 RepID=A0AAE0C815_9CHLO|nr:hypothetical protein CYMTET_41015 [Cymbomonas tetramitiformis]